MSSDKLGLLVLSHFHDDHISGLVSLLSPPFSIDLAIIPYLSPVERLVVSLTKRNMGKWYYRFLSSPVKYLLDNGAKKVMVLGGGESSDAEDKNNDNIDRPEYWRMNDFGQSIRRK